MPAAKRSPSTKEGLRPFTVVLLYPNELQPEVDLVTVSDHGIARLVYTYTAAVQAASIRDAAKAGQKEAAFAQSPRRKMVHFRVLAVFEGHHRNHWV